MSLEKLPLVTTLHRAARDANEFLLKECLANIKIHGISKEDLNMSDVNGRTALSYICSTNLTNILDEMLKLNGIDVNKADNEGNTPLHFAAEAGIHDIINMLLTRSRSIQVDAKNIFGFTPLMKAALHGRTKCAKLLLFAGANPQETDEKRGLRPEQWAQFSGRYQCAELIEKCSRSRLLEKSASCRWVNNHPGIENRSPIITRSKSNLLSSQNQSQNNNNNNLVSSGSFRNKFRKILPFALSSPSSKKSPKSKTMDFSTNLVSYLTATTICASGPALPSNENVNFIKSFLRPLEVPKVKVTSENNKALIKKYEQANYSETDFKTSPKTNSKM